MSAQCNPYVSQNCPHDCCDYLGYCHSFGEACYYYYGGKPGLSAGEIAGLVVGLVLLVLGAVGLAWWCRNRARAQPLGT